MVKMGSGNEEVLGERFNREHNGMVFQWLHLSLLIM